MTILLEVCEHFILIYSALCIGVAISSCVQPLSLTPSALYNGQKVTQAVKSSKTAFNQRECISFCVYIGDKTSIVYNPNTMACSCHNLPLSSLTMAPQAGAVAFGADTTPTDTVVLWIASVIDESSHFKGIFTAYPSTRMIGPADFYPGYANTQSAWCPKSFSKAHVELAISQSIYITEIHIYEVFYAGGVETVSIRDPNSNWVEVWKTPGLETLEYSRIFSPNFIPPVFKSNALRIDVDLGITKVWSEFDAVKVIGTQTRTRTSLP